MLAWAVVVLIAVPIQVTWLHYVAIGDVRPDLCLALTLLLGFLRGERQGILLGLGLGFGQDVMSSGELWLNMLTKGAAGLVAGIVGRRLAQTTVLSFAMLTLSVSGMAGLLFLFAGRTVGSLVEEALIVRTILLPQAAYDSAIAAGLYWLIGRRIGTVGMTGGAEPETPHVLSVR